MRIKNLSDLEKKYEYITISIALFIIISVFLSVSIICSLIMKHDTTAFIASSAAILILTDILDRIYKYIIAYEDKNVKDIDTCGKYNLCSFRYIGILVIVSFTICYIVSFIIYCINFNKSINDTIVLCAWTFVIGTKLSRLNSKINKYIKRIKG